MRTRTIIALFIAFLITIAVTALWSASTIERDGDPDTNVIEDSGSRAGGSNESSKTSKVGHIIAAPFKALGKLFGHKHDNKLERLSEKDAKNFESVAVARVSDSRFVAQQEPVSASAKEHLESGRAFLQSGRLNEAIAELSTAVSMDPKLAQAHSLLAVAFDQKGLYDRAKESYEKAVKAEPQDAQALNNLGFSLYQNGNYRAAIDRLKRAAKLAPKDERILNNLALALCRVGKFDEAYKSFARAGGELTGCINIATILERLGRDDQAIKYYEAARRIDPKNDIAAHHLADLYQRSGRTAQLASGSTAIEIGQK